jgi:lantibiotic modifying enzyme
MTSWCHGAPGIALGRACLWDTSGWDEHCSDEISIALQTTATLDPAGMDHLCCGSLGLMVLLRDLAQGPWPMQESVRQLAQDQAAQLHRQALDRCSHADTSLRCFGTQEGSLMLPGFFTGFSGMALALLDDTLSRSTVLRLLSAGLYDLHHFEGLGASPQNEGIR